MRKFKVRYYELTKQKTGSLYEEVKEDEIKALTFEPMVEGVVFYDENMNNKIAFYPNVISVKEVR